MFHYRPFKYALKPWAESHGLNEPWLALKDAVRARVEELQGAGKDRTLAKNETWAVVHALLIEGSHPEASIGLLQAVAGFVSAVDALPSPLGSLRQHASKAFKAAHQSEDEDEEEEEEAD